MPGHKQPVEEADTDKRMTHVGSPYVGAGRSGAGSWLWRGSASCVSRSPPVLLVPGACLRADRFQFRDPHQIDRRQAGDEHPVHPLCSPMARLLRAPVSLNSVTPDRDPGHPKRAE